ncbi:hypothetical protein CEUSTIGMA_g4811.t1 [Chlamydomonas eustigma]|uniref:Uncharacterized protein n=1 Tax=Chlamydomonas eustigma TaxID=1157962 RepID=A0A250X2T8_9CHLO|nr:hypothetical protein CEUSTIGMA_g4811.t1 [Chlamydomonas eustigma]|eukprot:GAX77365.1 hypothetical protein CEUSTIGMA_g4811.t1 [Chlamydomonas eustigma]
MSIRSNTSKSLGSLLLKGWAMLAENCPACNVVPLMRDPVTQDRHCVNCDAVYAAGKPLLEQQKVPERGSHYDERDNEMAQTNRHLDDNHKGNHQPQSANDADEHTQDEEELEEAAATACDATVASYRKEATSKHSVQRAAGMMSDALAPTNPDKPWPAPWRKGQSSDDTSQLLSEKMLQGWALLEKICPRCSTPLIRNKEKRMRCVTCQMWVMTEEEAATAATAAVASTTIGSTAAAAVMKTPVVGPCVLVETMPDVKQKVKGSGGTKKEILSGGELSDDSTALYHIINGDVIAHGAEVVSMIRRPPEQLLSQLSEALVQKLLEAQRYLAEIRVADSPETVKSVAGVVNECALALSRIRQEAAAFNIQ